ncbi:MAG: hypothetical protein ACE5FQ_09915, partial [Thiogranum sp.]
MFPNHNLESRHFLFAALFGILVFTAIIYLNNIPTRIEQGQQGITAIQLLDAMRRPLLATEEADLKRHMDSSEKTDSLTNFEKNIQTTQTLIERYQKASRYNPVLAKRVDELMDLVHSWVYTERKYASDHPPIASISRHLVESRLSLLHILAVLAEGEAPIHHDIEQGQAAEHLLQWSGATLVIYLFLLFIFFQRFRQKE